MIVNSVTSLKNCKYSYSCKSTNRLVDWQKVICSCFVDLIELFRSFFEALLRFSFQGIRCVFMRKHLKAFDEITFGFVILIF